MKMTYEQFYKKIEEYLISKKFNIAPRGPVLHEGFPGNFNLSMTEYEFLNQNKNFMDLKKDLVYSKIQPCIRFNDLEDILKQDAESYRYLLRFTMASVGNIYWEKDSSTRHARTRQVIEDTIGFLTNVCGLDVKRIYIQYLKEDTVSKLTDNKYTLSKKIENDPNLHIYKSLGIPEENFLPVQNRDGLLSLNIYGRPTPWGYRNEIYYMHGGKLLDIATIENLVFKPVFDEKDQLIDLVDYPHTLTLGAIGVERTLMVINNIQNIEELDIISVPALKLSTYLSPKTASLFVQILRTIMMIITDGGSYDSLSKRRKEKMRYFMSIICKIIQDKKIPEEIIAECASSICSTEPHLSEMQHFKDVVIKELQLHRLKEKYKQRWQEHTEEVAN